MKILFTSDLHGRKDLYEQTLALTREHAPRCVVIGGDLLPMSLKSPYKIVTGGFDFDHALRAQVEFIDSFLVPFFSRLKAGHPGVELLYIPGNHDWETAFTRLEELSADASCIHGAKKVIDGITFMGYGCVIDSSFWVKDYVRRDLEGEGFIRSRYPMVSTRDGIVVSRDGAYALDRPSMEEELSGLSLEDPSHTVCVFHSPPHGTGIDTLHNGRPIGSRAVTRFIEQSRPLVSLHGHIHEAPYMSGFYRTAIGPTLAVNPGHHPHTLHAVVFDTRDPAATITHSVFGRMPVTRTRSGRVKDRYARMIKGFFMKKVLMR